MRSTMSAFLLLFSISFIHAVWIVSITNETTIHINCQHQPPRALDTRRLTPQTGTLKTLYPPN